MNYDQNSVNFFSNKATQLEFSNSKQRQTILKQARFFQNKIQLNQVFLNQFFTRKTPIWEHFCFKIFFVLLGKVRSVLAGG